MEISGSVIKFNNSKPLNALRAVLSSRFLPFFTATIMLVDYYLGLDLLSFYYLGICSVLILLLLDDISPLISFFVFLNVSVSMQHTPSMFTTGSNYFFQPAILSQLIVIVVFLIGSIITRMVLSIKDGRVKLTPTLFGLIGFSVLLLCNGFFNDDFNIFNTLYGAVLVFCFLGIFVLGCGNIKVNDKTFERLAYTFIALGILLMVELAVIYLTYDGIVVDGMVNRSVITFGWGTYNQAGMLFAISTPSALYLACKKNWGWVFTIYSVILLTATFFAMSRQAIVAVPIVFVIGTIVTLVKGKHRLVHLAILVISAVVAVLTIKLNWEIVDKFFDALKGSLETGSGRTYLYMQALAHFEKYPIFGIGFFSIPPHDPDATWINLIPRMYHDTFMQLMGTCGAFATIAYAVHRTQTIISFAKNITVERIFVALTILGLLIVNLFDNHIFYIMPTIVYSMLVALLINSEGYKKI